MKVLNFGSLNIDSAYSVDHMIIEGETQTSVEMNTSCGGKGLNQSIALARAGAEVYHAGLIGEAGQVFAKACRKNGVHTGHIRQVSDKILYIIDQAYEKGMKIILNLFPCDALLKECNFTKISMLLMNEIEGWQITGEKESKWILEILKKRYSGMEVILTQGQDGSFYQKDEERYHQDIFSVQVVNTTAAGDAFTGYFIAARAEDLTFFQVLKRVAKAVSIAVSRRKEADFIQGKKEVG